MFKPDDKCQTSLVGYPTVLITEEAARDMWIIVDEVSTEVGWMARVTMTKEKNLLVDKIYLLHQQAHSTTTELTEDGLTKLADELLSKGADGMKEWNSCRGWLHSHVHMPTNPSGQDDTQMETFAKASIPWMLRGIANKKGEIRWDLYMYDYGFQLKNLPYKILFPEVDDKPKREAWKKQISERVKGFSTHTTTYSGAGYPGYTPPGGGTEGYSGGYGGGYGGAYRGGGRASNGKARFRGKIFSPVFGVGLDSATAPTTPPAGGPAGGPAGSPAGVPAGGSTGGNPSNGFTSGERVSPGGVIIPAGAGSTTGGTDGAEIPSGSRFDGRWAD